MDDDDDDDGDTLLHLNYTPWTYQNVLSGWKSGFIVFGALDLLLKLAPV